MYKVKGIMYMIHSVALIIADFLFSKDAITEEEKEDAGAGPASEGLSGYDRARGDKIQHRPFHTRRHLPKRLGNP